MSITREDSKELGPYYANIPNAVSPCEPSNKTKWCSFSPYTKKETFKWVLKMLILPGGIAAIIIFLLIFELYDNIITRMLTSVFTIIATFLIYIYSREKILTIYHKIQDNEELAEGLEPELNEIEEPKLTIGFVGDIMMMRNHELEFDSEIKKFFEKVPIIVGNLEGIIPEQKNRFAKQSHPKKILDDLMKLVKDTNTTWLLCVSNNHSVDFGNNLFFTSTKDIQNPKDGIKEKFNAFGRYDVPKVFINDKYCISTATKWSNQKCWECTSDYKEIDNYYCSEDKIKFNILYPHWGFENERYTRRNIQEEAEGLLKNKWDLIFGHHPHTRQPVMIVKEELDAPARTPLSGRSEDKIKLKKLVAFSGGNFTSGVKWLRRKKHIHGIIMKCKIGPLVNSPDHYAVGEVEWWNTFNEKDGDTKIVKKGKGIADRTRIYILLIGIAAFIIAFLPRVLELFP